MVVPIVLVVANGIATVVLALQYTTSAGWVTCPNGLTVIVNVFAGPGQLTLPKVKVGVTVMVATTGAVPVLVAVKEGIVPVPLAPKPILGAELVQA